MSKNNEELNEAFALIIVELKLLRGLIALILLPKLNLKKCGKKTLALITDSLKISDSLKLTE